MSGSHASWKDGEHFDLKKEKERREGGKMKEEEDGGRVSGPWRFLMMRTPRRYNRIGVVVRKKEEEQPEEKEHGPGFHPWT